MGICVHAAFIFLAIGQKKLKKYELQLLKIEIITLTLILSAQLVKNEHVLNLKIFQKIIT